jgi:hypothetical protein
MAIPTERRGYATGGSRSGLYLEVSPEAKERLRLMHEATGAPKWALVEALLQQAELDDDGRPVFWPDPAIRQEALDIPA